MTTTDAVLLPYQQRWISDTSNVKVIEKSRQIGITWAEAADSVLKAATAGRGGKDTWYIGANEEGALEFMQDCTFWVKQYQEVATEVTAVSKRELVSEGVVFPEEVIQSEKDILAYRIKLASGYRVTGLTSRPTNLRGKKGRVILDEFAFHPNPMELLKAAIALLMWGGSVHVISTHDGVTNAFNQLIEEVKSGKRPYSLHKVTFDDAIADGLYKRICLMTDKKWSVKGQERWRQDMIDQYGDDADEELFCNPKAGGGAYIPPLLVEARMDKRYSVVRLALPDEFNIKSQSRQLTEIQEWLNESIYPLLNALPRTQKSYYGMDFGRTGDISAIAIVLEDDQLGLTVEGKVRLYCPLITELRNVPIKRQEQILYGVIDHLPNFCGGASDARGNGTALAEFAETKYGASRIEKVMPSQPWYLEAMPDYKKALEDERLRMPYDEDIKTDHAAIEEHNGVPKVPERSRYKGKDGKKRHGDAAIALVLANYAARKKSGKILKQDAEDEKVRDFFEAARRRQERTLEGRSSAREIRGYF